MADILNDSVNSNPAISMNIAIDRLNILQTGDGVVPYVVDDRNGAEVLNGYGGGGAMDQILTGATNSYLEQSYGDLLKQTFAGLRRQAIDAAVDYNNATQSVVIRPGDHHGPREHLPGPPAASGRQGYRCPGDPRPAAPGLFRRARRLG